ncbi:MAG: hypothetical protein GY953_52220 [bacterium]|nr:hypothetical protein [bacterium]
MIVEWALGAGGQGVTFVSRGNQSWYLEHSFSYYTAIQGMDVTPGHDYEPETLEHAMGVLYETLNPETGIIGCFECHSTGPVTAGKDGVLSPHEPGVRCEACHGPGKKHVEAIGKGRLKKARGAIRNPRRLSADRMIHFCGACHRRPTLGRDNEDLDDPWNTRHSSVYLSLSRCFKKSKGRLTCLTCHDPHLPLRRSDPAHYSAQCATCHEPASHPEGHFAATESADCTGCHMPTVKPHPHLAFHNHWIGVYREGETIRPERWCGASNLVPGSPANKNQLRQLLERLQLALASQGSSIPPIHLFPDRSDVLFLMTASVGLDALPHLPSFRRITHLLVAQGQQIVLHTGVGVVRPAGSQPLRVLLG